MSVQLTVVPIVSKDASFPLHNLTIMFNILVLTLYSPLV